MINEKGHRDIVVALMKAQRRRLRGEAPAFERGRMYFDFEAGKVRVAPAPDVR